MSDPDEEDGIPKDADSGVGDGDRFTREDEEEDFFDACQGTASNRLSLRSASESCQSRGGTGRSHWSHYTQRCANNRQQQRHDLMQSNHSQLFVHDLIGLGGPRRRRVGRPDTIPATPLESVPPAFPPPTTKTKFSSSAKSRKCKELVVGREDGFIREEVVLCVCTQATCITSALHPLTVFIL